MEHAYGRQPPRGAKVAKGSPLGRGIAAHFLFNGDFRSAVPGRTGNPVITPGPTIVAGPRGRYAKGNGSGKIVTDLYPAALGMAGAAPRTIIAEFDQGDTSGGKCVFSLGDSSATGRSQMSLVAAFNYRTVRLELFGEDLPYNPWDGGGTAARVFLAITYDGNRTVTFRSWADVSDAMTGAYIGRQLRTQTFTLGAQLNTGNTVPLNLMGGGTYGFDSMNTALYHLSLYGGRCLSPNEIDRLYADRHQVIAPRPAFPYASLSAPQGAGATAAPLGVQASASVGAASATAGASAAPSGVTAAALVGTASAAGGARAAAADVTASGRVGTPTASGGAAAAPAGVSASAQVGAATAAGGNASIAAPAGVSASASVGVATASAGAKASPQGVTAAALVGTAAASAGSAGQAFATGVSASASVGAASASGGARCAPAGVRASASVGVVSAAGGIAVPGGPIDISKIHPSRIAVFEGSGSRVAVFEGSGSRVSRFT